MRTHKLIEFILESDLEKFNNSNPNISAYNAVIIIDTNFADTLLHAEYIYDHDGYLIELHKGDVVGDISISKQLVSTGKYYQITNTLDYQRFQFQLFAPQDAYYIFPKTDNPLFNQKIPYDNGIVLCKSFETIQETAECFVENECNYTISKDIFTGEKRILWKNWFKLHFNGGESFPFVTLHNSKEQFVLKYLKKKNFKNNFTTHVFNRGDRLRFMFEGNQYIDIQLKSKESNTDKLDYKQVSFSLLPQDIVLFSTKSLMGIRFEFINGDEGLDLTPKNELAVLSLKLYFQKYIEALLECGVDIDKIPAANESVKRPVNELSDESTDASCFVYLMKDESNGYHKIGISNKPEYRERTLQSEKPTIVLLCAKKFPSRVIAEAIEAALHKAYGNKRLRGEWFELDNKDVTEIVESLS